MVKIIKKTIDNIENSKTPIGFFILSFFFSINLRNFLEAFSTKNFYYFNSLNTIVHYNIFYISLAISLVILFFLLVKKNIFSAIKIILTSFLIVILPPIIDLIVGRGKGSQIAYLVPNCHDNIFERFFLFFGDLGACSFGITTGIKTEIFIVLVFSFFYFFTHNKKIIKSLFSSLLVYMLIFIHVAFPFVLKNLFLPYETVDILSASFLTLIFFTGTFLLYLINKEYFKIIIKDIRPFRLLHYFAMFGLGIYIAGAPLHGYNTGTIHDFILIFIVIALAWIYSVMTNNIADIKIDKVSNIERPLAKESIPLSDYKKISWIVLVLALIYASLTSFMVLFFIFIFIGNYFIYSVDPLRIKRVPILSKSLIAFNSLILVLLGYIIGNYNSIDGFPNILYLFFLIGYTLVLNFIDIKDYEGDKLAGIKTIPVILGLKKAKILIGLFFISIYLSICLIYPTKQYIYLFPLLGLLQFYVINKKNYKELYIFLIYLFSLVLFFIIF
jgi:4-hydroxybenzoate polyprenyltransferase